MWKLQRCNLPRVKEGIWRDINDFFQATFQIRNQSTSTMAVTIFFLLVDHAK